MVPLYKKPYLDPCDASPPQTVSTRDHCIRFLQDGRGNRHLDWQALARKGLSSTKGHCVWVAVSLAMSVYYFYESNLASGQAQTEGLSALV